MNGFNVLLPAGPSITVHKGWDVPGRKKKAQGNTRIFGDKIIQINHEPGGSLEERQDRNLKNETSTTPRHFEFIQSSSPGTKNPQVQKIVRTHVRNDYLHRTSHQSRSQLSIIKPSPPKSSSTSPPNQSLALFQSQISPLIGNPTSLQSYTYPIPLSPSAHVLLEFYLAHAPPCVYPLESCLKSNPLRSPEWFWKAVGDEAMLMGILYAGALYKAMREGRGESREMWEYEGRCAGVVRRRLEGKGGLKEGEGEGGDEGIGAVTCLALGEAIAGRPKLWRVHMEGIKEMLRLRKSKRPLAKMIEAKIRRADITGAIDYFTPPILTSTPSSHPPIWDTFPVPLRLSLTQDSDAFFLAASVSSALIPILKDLVLFTQTIYWASENKIHLDPEIFTEGLYSLEGALLSFPSPTSLSMPPSSPANLDKAIRVASLLYLKAILQEFPHSNTGPRVLLLELRDSLISLPRQNSERGREVLVWSATVGACFSGEEGEMRGWFVEFSRGLIGVDGILDVGGGEMERLLGLKGVFGGGLLKLCGER